MCSGMFTNIMLARNAWMLLLLAEVAQVAWCRHPEVISGSALVLPVARSMFFNQDDAPALDPVRFIPSQMGLPDPPSWLQFVQQDGLQDGFLYGTPKANDESVTVEVVAVNERTQQTAYKTFNITILEGQAEELNIVELWILNYDLHQLLSGGNLMTLKRHLGRIWPQSGDLILVKVMSLAEHEGMVPVPNLPGKVIHEGVIVHMGSTQEFSPELQDVPKHIDADVCQNGNGVTDPPDNIKGHFYPEYHVDWCHFKLVMPEMQPPSTAAPAQPIDLSSSAGWVQGDASPRRDFTIDFFITVVFPLVLGIVLFLILSYIMFGRRQGMEERNRMASETQLEQFDTIRRATTNLRYMSQRRDGPPVLNPRHSSTSTDTPSPTAHSTLNRAGEPAGSLTRGAAPPPYRMPLSYPAPGGADNLGASPAHGSADSPGSPLSLDGAGEEQRLVPDTSPETLRVRK